MGKGKKKNHRCDWIKWLFTLLIARRKKWENINVRVAEGKGVPTKEIGVWK